MLYIREQEIKNSDFDYELVMEERPNHRVIEVLDCGEEEYVPLASAPPPASASYAYDIESGRKRKFDEFGGEEDFDKDRYTAAGASSSDFFAKGGVGHNVPVNFQEFISELERNEVYQWAMNYLKSKGLR